MLKKDRVRHRGLVFCPEDEAAFEAGIKAAWPDVLFIPNAEFNRPELPVFTSLADVRRWDSFVPEAISSAPIVRRYRGAGVGLAP